MYCKNCGKECLAEAVACTGCGVPPHKGNKFCQSCGEGTNTEAIMCVKCGASLKKSSSIDLSASAGEIKDKLMSSFNEFSKEQKMSVGAATLMIVSSVILPWFTFGRISVTLFDSGSMHAFVLIALSIAIIVFNFKSDSEKAKYASFGAIAYLFIVLFTGKGDVSDFFDFAGIGFYLFVISAGASAYFCHKENG
jgi:hypothetical protein